LLFYKKQGTFDIKIKPCETKSEALYFANLFTERVISIRSVEKPIQMKLNTTKIQKVCEEEIKEWVFS